MADNGKKATAKQVADAGIAVLEDEREARAAQHDLTEQRAEDERERRLKGEEEAIRVAAQRQADAEARVAEVQKGNGGEPSYTYVGPVAGVASGG